MKRWIAILLALILTMAMSAFAEEADASDPKKETLAVASVTPMSGNFFSTVFGNNTSDIDVQKLLHGCHLVRWNHETGLYEFDESIVNGVVTTGNADGDHTYSIALNKGLRYSDGTPITARDYAFSILLSLAPEVEAIGGAVDRSGKIAGAAAWQNKDSEALAGVRVIDDFQLEITISHDYLPYFYELSMLDYGPYPISEIAPGCRVEDDGNGVRIVNIDEKIQAPVFTAELLRDTMLDAADGYITNPDVVSGPYTLKSFDGTAAALEANPYYIGNYKRIKPQIKHITFTYIANKDIARKLHSKEIGLINKVTDTNVIDSVLNMRASDEKFAACAYLRTGLSFISYCFERPGMDSAAVRKAIAMCLDKDQVVSDYVGRFGARVDANYGLGQWMVRIVNGTQKAPVAAGDPQAQEWKKLNLDGMKIYSFDPEQAEELLIEDGWTLNRSGERFDPAKDDVRCKMIDDGIGSETLTALDLKLVYPEGNTIVGTLKTNFADNLKKIGVALTLEPMDFNLLKDSYYRRVDRDCDMIYMAVNFGSSYDPSVEIEPGSANNCTGVNDAELYQLSLKMRSTKAGDLLEYMKAWISFQQRWAEVLPAISVYSNEYFDFYTDELHGYSVQNDISWGDAIVSAYLSDESDAENDRVGEYIENAKKGIRG